MAWGAHGTGAGTVAGSATVLTILFTDIEGSTARNEQLGDELWVAVLSAHDAAVRRALTAHDGAVVKAFADGVMAVFGRPAPAVRAGLDLQQALRHVPLPGAPAGLPVRVGVHAGRVICRADDVVGHHVNLARRITSAAAPGEVLVSTTVKVLVERESALRSGPARCVRLSGIAESQLVYDMAAGPGPVVADPPRRPAHLRLLPSSS